MECPLCGLSGIDESAQTPLVTRGDQLTSDQLIVLAGIANLRESCPDLDGIIAEDIESYATGLGVPRITQEIATDLLVDLTAMELVRINGWAPTQTNEWQPAVQLTIQGQHLLHTMEV